MRSKSTCSKELRYDIESIEEAVATTASTLLATLTALSLPICPYGDKYTLILTNLLLSFSFCFISACFLAS